MSQCSNSIDLLIIYNGRTGLDKLCGRSPPFFACTKLRARKSIKTSLSSIRMLFKVVTYFYVRNQIIFGTIRSNIISFSLETAVKYSYKYNHDRNILRIFNALPNFPFTTSETKPDY